MSHSNKALILTITALLLSTISIQAQDRKRVLFVGNSYTYTNAMPDMIAGMAASVGCELLHTSNTPGGCTFQQHCTNHSMALIQQGGWDAVILQEQSQYPSFPQSQVEAEVFPYAAQLVSAIYAASPCAEPMFYMTWGRRDGDQQNAQYFPILGTYEGMDSMLYERYMYMAEANDASVSPVGRVWRKLRREHPEIELYDSDGSHPSLAGTYAAACTFYAMLFHHDPIELTYNGSLDREVASTIRLAASDVVWSHETSLPQSQWLRHSTTASFDTSIFDFQFSIFNFSTHADSLFLNFGDGTTLSTSANTDTISHTYSDSGSYTVTLVASRHCMTDTASLDIHINYLITDTTTTDTTTTDPVGITDADLPTSPWANQDSRVPHFEVFPNPTTGTITIVASSSSPIAAKIFTPSGQALKHSNIHTLSTEPTEHHKHSNAQTLDLSSLPKGPYLLYLQQGNTTETHKIVKY